MRASLDRALQRLTKWRRVLAAWQLGSAAMDGDARTCRPHVAAVRDHREVTLLMRAELSAVVGLLVKRGPFTLDEFEEQLEAEAMHLDLAHEAKFPGITATATGLTFENPEALRTVQSFDR